MIVDNDLVSVQQARVLAERAFEAQKKLATFTQARLDALVEHVAAAVLKHAQALAVLSQEETDFGLSADKYFKNQFICTQLPQHMRTMTCVGLIDQDKEQRLAHIGVPVGVIVALSPVNSPVSTTIYKTLLALKSGNAIIFSPHPRAQKCMRAVLDIMIAAAHEQGLPEGCLAYLDVVNRCGSLELMQHRACALIWITGVPGLLTAARRAGKPLIYGGTGNGPAFVERSANIAQAAHDIVRSKSFDHGIAPSAEQSIIAEACIAESLRHALQSEGAYFMSESESLKLAELLFCAQGKRRKEMVGKPASLLARRAGFDVPPNTCLLIAQRTHVTDDDPYAKELLSPVLAFYVEEDWRHACEKSIELLLHERNAHTLSIHSYDEEVILQFALKKPVGRLLVNTPAAFGGMGVSTNLFPAMTLGSGNAGYGITADNVSPRNLIYTRTVGYGVRPAPTSLQCPQQSAMSKANANASLDQILQQAIKMLDRPV